MQSLTQTGAIYRTRLMEREKALRFARCLAANPKFKSVMVVESRRSSDRWIVTFVPANPERVRDMIGREQATREVRGLTEGSAYVFALDKNGGRPFFYCFSTSGEVYETTTVTCSCPDFEYRCRGNGLRCKHQIALIAGAAEVRG